MSIPVRNIPSDRQTIVRQPNAVADPDWFRYWQDLGGAVRGLQAGPVAPTYMVATLPAPATLVGATIYVANESGGATLAFSDGANWRRVQDRAIVT